MTDADHDFRRRILRSLLWQLMGVGGQRILQLAGWAVVTRQIPKADVGLNAVLLVGIGVIESLTLFVGEQSTISSKRTIDRPFLNTVFTVGVLRSLAISLLLVGLAWPLAWYFSDPESASHYWLPGLFLALAPVGMLDALKSPARAARMKGLDFRRIVVGDFVAVALGLGLTIVLALQLHNVWALILGHLGMTAIKSIISYVAAPHRPGFCLDRDVLKELFHYSVSALGAPFLLLMILSSPALVLGKVLATKGPLAVYDMAGRIAKLPEDIFQRVLGPVAIPAYAQLQNDLPRLGRAWLRAVHAFVMLGAPMTVAMIWCGDAAPAFAFGADYGSINGLFALLSLHGGLAGLTSVIGPLFWAVGRPTVDRRVQFWRCVLMFGAGIPAAIYGGAIGFAAATCLAIATALTLSVIAALDYLKLPFQEFLSAGRDGLLFGGGLLLLLLGVDLFVAPTGLLRVIITGAASAPVLAFVGLRLLKERKQKGDPPPPVEGAPEQSVDETLADKASV